MTQLLNAEFEDETGTVRRLTRDEVLTYVQLLAGAGNETTTRLIGWMGKLLAEHPDQRRQLAADRSLIPGAIEEILRYEAPSPIQARYVAVDVEHYGQKISAGSIMVLLNGSANRDERRFARPDRFDIQRQVGRHLSFGHGIHLCLGAALARLEGRVALDEVLSRFPDVGGRLPERRPGSHLNGARLGDTAGVHELNSSPHLRAAGARPTPAALGAADHVRHPDRSVPGDRARRQRRPESRRGRLLRRVHVRARAPAIGRS